DFEKWMYFIKNLERLEKIPKKYRDTIFEKMFAAAEIAKLDKMEYRRYIKSKKAINDYDNAINYAREEGELKGRLEGELKGKLEGELKGKLDIARTMLKMEKPIDEIVLITGLSKEQIEELEITN
ncbi:MAG: PD-(D/E)XK nuclease family transposase, partial [Bacteroidales bacterium]|nr:PD-(D/E)XK nuclease family transposase [Bacteroidales bacterium]